MGQKINPNGFRLGISIDHKSQLVRRQAVQVLRRGGRRDPRLLSKGMERAGISNVEIERNRDRVRVYIHTARPGIVIGRNGAEADRIRGELEKLTGKQVQLNILEVRVPRPTRSWSRRAWPSSSPAGSVPPGDAQGDADVHALGRPGHEGAVLGPPQRRRDVAQGVLPRGPRAAAHAAGRHRLRLLRGQDHLRPDRREGVDVHGRDRRQRCRASGAGRGPRRRCPVGSARRPQRGGERRQPWRRGATGRPARTARRRPSAAAEAAAPSSPAAGRGCRRGSPPRSGTEAEPC